MKTQNHLFLLICLTFSFFTGLDQLDAQEADERPNILLIVADDLGYADLGCYGGDVETTNIDQLAEQGIRFSRYHSAPKCAPARAMLLSGNDNHIAGMGFQGYNSDSYGYEGNLTNRVALIPELLQKAGYSTYMAGKWHLGVRKKDGPKAKGFDRSFAMKLGAANHYDDQGIFESFPESPYTEHGQNANWPDGAYSTDLYTDKLISYIRSGQEEGKPFFAYAAYTSPHWPLQVDEEYWRKYEGRYDEGYEQLRRDRLESLKAAGMIPETAVLPDLHGDVRPWNELSDAEKATEARKMELYAGMVDNLDYNIGRLLQFLKDIDEYDNTLIIFISDNGAAPEDYYYHDHYGPFIRQHFNMEYENMGSPSSFVSYGPQWAEASSAPFKYFKTYPTEGGLIAPMVISGPQVKNKGQITHGFATVVDLAPTIYEYANVEYPSVSDGYSVHNMTGRALSSVIEGKKENAHTPAHVWAMEHAGRSFVIRGDLKLVHMSTGADSHYFGLFNLANDPAEMYDLSDSIPEQFHQLHDLWKQYIHVNQVQFPTPGDE